MEKIYTKSSSNGKQQRQPRKETIDFLLNYSKALSVIDYEGMKLETILN